MNLTEALEKIEHGGLLGKIYGDGIVGGTDWVKFGGVPTYRNGFTIYPSMSNFWMVSYLSEPDKRSPERTYRLSSLEGAVEHVFWVMNLWANRKKEK